MLTHALRPACHLLLLASCIALATAPVMSQGPDKDKNKAAPAPGAPATPGTLPKAPPKEVEVESEVDLVKLLNRELVFPAAAPTDSIWQVSPSDGRIVMRVPLKITKPATAVNAGGANVKVRGGRFICWQLIDPKEETTSGVAPAAATASINPVGTDALPVNVPRMARSILIDPDGTITWKMERAISGAKVVEGTTANAYAYKLNPAAVEKLNPGNPPRIVRNAGESAADFTKRKQPAEEEYRKKSATYRELRTQLLKLPDEFKGPTPSTFWALYDSRSNPKTIEFDGAAPLPWEVSFELLLQLQRVHATGSAAEAGAAPSGVSFSATSVEENIATALLAAEKTHPYTVRLVANAVTLSSYLEKMEEGDAKYQVLEKILACKEATATADVMKYLAVRPSKASASLMKKAIAAGLLDPKAQLSSIRGMLDTIAENPNLSVDNAVLTINQFLADPKGPPAKESLTALLNLARGKQNMSDQIAKTIRFDAPAGPRRDELLVSVIEAAAADPLAASILDGRILGSEDATLQERALYLISRCVRAKMPVAFTDYNDKPIAIPAGTKLIVLDFWANWCPPCVAIAPELVKLQKLYAPQGVAFVGVNMDKDKATLELAAKELGFTWPHMSNAKSVDSDLSRQWGIQGIPFTIVLSPAGDILWRGFPQRLAAALDAQLAAKPAPAPSASDTDPRPRPVGDVLILQSDANIFKLLVDTKLRNLAWAALGNMTMALSKDSSKWPAVLVDAAVNQSPTPVSAVHFIAKHDDPGVCDALVQVITRADSNASKVACRYLLGSGLPVDQSLAKLPVDGRHAFGMTFYENIVVEAPFSVGLLRDKADNSKVLGWFGRQVSLGRLPEPAKWIQPYGSSDRIAEMVLASDEQLALGAIGTLVASVGGSGADTPGVATKLRASKELPEAGKAWATLRKELFASKLKAASVNYTLSIRFGEPVKESKEGDFAWTAPKALGEVTMKVEGPTVTINKATAAVATDDSCTLQLKGGDLKNLGDASSPLAVLGVTADKVIALQPQGINGWFSEITLTDGRKVEITLEAKR